MVKGLIVGVVIIVLVILGFFLFSGDDSSSVDSGVGDIGGSSEGGIVISGEEDAVPAPGNEDVEERVINVGGERTVSMTPAGFSPNTLEISVGDSVQFINQGSGRHRPATDIHPSHSVYPGSSIGKCGTTDADKIFDACEPLERGESYTFTFNEVGTWRYHDHLNPGMRGTMLVR